MVVYTCITCLIVGGGLSTDVPPFAGCHLSWPFVFNARDADQKHLDQGLWCLNSRVGLGSQD
jgi:hypothetical protein